MFLNDTKCAHSSRFKGKGNCHQHRVTRAAQTAGTRLISVTCFMVHALMLVRLDHRCNIGLLLCSSEAPETVIKADSRHFVHSTGSSLCLCSAAAPTFAPSEFLGGAGITMTPVFCFLVNGVQSYWVQRSASSPSRPRGCRWTCGLNQRPCTNCAHTFLRRAKMSSHFGTVQLK